MRISLAAIGLGALAVGLALTGTDAGYAFAWVAFGASVLTGLGGAINALTDWETAWWKRVAAFVLGSIPAALVVYFVVAIAVVIHSGGFE